MAEKPPSMVEATESVPQKEGVDSVIQPQDVTDSSSRPSAEMKPEPAGEEERVYLTGIKLFMVLTGVTLVCFLVLLDISIIVTVSLCF
jgi:hypothetical protein